MEGVLRLHDEANEVWHAGGNVVAESELAGRSLDAMILAQHRANFDLWHKEDEARDPEAPDAAIAEVKHAIDALNQRRNDLTETIDDVLCAGTEQRLDAPLHSETPGMMLDRLSIIALKVYHTREEAIRESAEEDHREKNRIRLATLNEQREDLALCLEALMEQVERGERRFKVYRQMKMYNDPELNPVLYRRGHRC